MLTTELNELLQIGSNEKETFNRIKTAITDDYTEVAIDILPADALAFGATPVQLLPAAGAGKYWEYEGILEKLDDGSTIYGTVDYFAVIGQASYVGLLIQASGWQTSNAVFSQFSSKNPVTGVTAGDAHAYPQPLNDNLVFTSYNGDDMGSNTASYRVVLRYRLRTLGA